MIEKRLISFDRLRRIPKQFSWVDHRLVRNNYICNCDHTALALYLFLVTVSDSKGLSYYSDAKVGKFLSSDEERVIAARVQLIKAGLIAYLAPIYQVLSLDVVETEERHRSRFSENMASSKSPRTNGPVSIGDVISSITGGDQ